MLGLSYKNTAVASIIGAAAAPVNTDFVMVWTTTSADQLVTYPATGTNNFEIDWGDGNSETITTASPTHTYAGAAAQYIVTATGGGSMPIFGFNGGGDRALVDDIANWGSVGWSGAGLVGAFSGCSNMVVSATDAGAFGGITSLYESFKTCLALRTLDISAIDLSANTTFFSTFRDIALLENVIFPSSGTSALNTMRNIFRNSFKNSNAGLVDLTPIDVSGVTDMSLMTFGASGASLSFNLTGWVTSALTTINSMFSQATNVDVDISHFDITGLTDGGQAMSLSAFSQTNYDLLLVAWEGQVEKTGVTFHAGSAKYSTGAPATARGVLTGTSTWTITDGGLNILVQDTFTDTNGVLLAAHTPDIDDVGTGWSNVFGTADIQGNRLAALTNDGVESRCLHVVDCGSSDFVYSSIVHTQASGNMAVGLIFRYIDNANYIQCTLASPSYAIYERAGGVFTERGVATKASIGNSDYTMEITANGDSIGVTVDGVSPLDITLATHQTATQVGVYSKNNTDTEWDDLEVNSI